MTDELTFPVELDEWVEFSTYEITVGHSAREECLTVTASGWAKIGDQVIYSAPRHSREGEHIRVKCGGRDWDVPLDKWRAFVDRVPVRVDGRSRSTIEMTPQLVQMARDVIAYRREAPADDQWAKEIGASMSDEAKTLVIQKTMKLDFLILDPEMQPRIELSQEVIDEYAEAMQRGDTFPPLEVYQVAVGSSHNPVMARYVTDGWHRLKAAQKAGLTELPVEIHMTDSRRDAVLAAAGANTKHGLRRSNEDKRKAIRTWLRDDEGATWSDNAIATQLHVSNKLVKAVREELEALGEIQVVTERRTADGRVIDTSNIGQNQPEPKSSIKPGDRVVSIETGEVLGVVSSLVPMPGTKGKKALIKKDDGGSMWASEVDLRIAQTADDEPRAEPSVSPAKPAPKPTPAPAPKPEIPDWLTDYRKLVDETGSVVMFAVGEGQHVLVAFEKTAIRVAHALRQYVIGTKVGPDLVSCIKVHDLHEPTMDRLYDEFGAGLMIVTEDIDPKLKQFVDTRITTTAEYQPPMDEAAKQAAVREQMVGIFPGQGAQPSAGADGSSPPPWVTGEATTETSKPTFTVVGPFAMAMQRTTRFLGHALQTVADADEETTEEREHAIAHYMRGIVENNVQAVYDILSKVSEPKNLKALGDLIENRDEGRSADAVIRDWLWAKKQEADKPAEPEILELKVQGEEDDAA